jgi:hypothetical protein
MTLRLVSNLGWLVRRTVPSELRGLLPILLHQLGLKPEDRHALQDYRNERR